jgi:hypothetical protein
METRRRRDAGLWRWLVPALAGLAVVLAGLALLVSATRGDTPRGRIVDAATRESYLIREPVLFALDDFFLVPLQDGSFVALYAYPPGNAGHVRGCRIRWEPTMTFEAYQAGTGATPVPIDQQMLVRATGLWHEGCHGSRWDARGQYLFGPAGRDLDRFPVRVLDDGRIRIDTRRLHCSARPCRRVWGRR